MRSLRSALIDEPLPRLMAIAEAWDLFLEAASPRELAEKLPAIMGHAEHLSRAKTLLPDEALTALDALLDADGRMPVAVFERRFGVLRQMGPGKLERERPWITPANITETLWYRGFIFRGFDRNTPPNTVYYFAEEIKQLLQRQQKNKRAAYAKSQDADIALESRQASSNAARIHNDFVDDMVTVLTFIQNSDAQVKANGDWQAAAHAALLPMLRDPHPNRLTLLLHLLKRLKWLRDGNDNGRLRLASQPVIEWLQSPADAQLRCLYEIWRDDAAWNDLSYAPNVLFDMAHTWHNNPLQERTRLIEWLIEWLNQQPNQPPVAANQQPFGLASIQLAQTDNQFQAHVKATHPDFARPDGRYDTWHIRDASSRDFLHGFANWDRIEGGLIQYLLHGPLQWFAPQPTRTEPPISDATLQFDPNAPATVLIGSHRRFERFQLARIADWQHTAPGQYTYRITPQSLARAKEQNIAPDRVIDFLQRNSGQALQNHLKMAILRWGERGVEIKSDQMLVFRVKDAALLDQILSLPAIQAIKIERLTPTCFICQQNDREIIQKTIAQNGLLM